LDEDISKYIGYKVRNPNYPDEIITIRMLANHVSSLNDGIGYDGFLDATYSAVIPDVKELLLPEGGYYTKDMWMKYKPGMGYIYCNSGYGLLGTIVEKVSGERFDQYCIKHIFNPLKMKSRFNVDDVDLKNLAVLYRDTIPQYDNYGAKKEPRDLSHYTIGTNAAAFSPQGGLRTSAIDLAKFLLMHINKGSYKGAKILNDTTALILQGKVFPSKGLGNTDKNRGVSIHYTQSLLKGNVLIGHAGGAYGLVSGMYFDKYRRYGIIFFANGGDYGPDDGYSQFEKDLTAVIYDYLRPKIDIMNEIFVDPDLQKALPKENVYKMPEVKRRKL
jgi:CubicO group peptidase (beta-lactamase class C family)